MRLNIKNMVRVDFDCPPYPFSGHFCFGFAEEKCPKCGGILFMIFAPSEGEYRKLLLGKQGIGHKVFGSCVSCEFGVKNLYDKVKITENLNEN